MASNSVAERSAHNRMVAGSNPAGPHQTTLYAALRGEVSPGVD